MELAVIGLGRMGANMARRLRRGKARVAGYDRTFDVSRALEAECGIEACQDLPELVSGLKAPRILWMMLPADEPTQSAIDHVAPLLESGDIVVDGGNSYYRDSIARAGQLKERGIYFVDAGVSGGIWGLEEGYALMAGGEADAIARVEPVLKILAPAPDRGWLHCGPSGSGHFVKMVHNGIEYGMMQALAEGLALMKARDEFALDLAQVTEMWRHGSVVRSWMLDLTSQFLQHDQTLEGVKPYVADTGEGRWTAIEAIELAVPAPVMSLALMMRFASQNRNDYAARLLAMMREGFGGHLAPRNDP